MHDESMRYTRVGHATLELPALLLNTFSCRQKGVPWAEVASLQDANLAKLFDHTPTGFTAGKSKGSIAEFGCWVHTF